MTIYVVGKLTDAEHDLLQGDGWQLLAPESAINDPDAWAVRLDESNLVTFLDNLQPPDFKRDLESMIARGLDDDEILGHLDPDTAGVDLIGLIRKLMSTVTCRFCHQETTTKTAHRHEDLWVCDGCWDERLRSTS